MRPQLPDSGHTYNVYIPKSHSRVTDSSVNICCAGYRAKCWMELESIYTDVQISRSWLLRYLLCIHAVKSIH